MMKESQQLLVDPKPMVELVKTQSSLATVYLTKALAETWGKQFDDAIFNTACLYSYLFELGRIQGIREERARHRKSPQQ